MIPEYHVELAEPLGQVKILVEQVVTAGGGGGGGGTVDSAMSDSSTNAVQNRVIKAYVDGAIPTIDSALSSSSENPVQNKVINTALGKKAALASPTLTGTPKAPTATAGTNTTQIATTAFVQTAVSGKQNTLTFDTAPTDQSTNPVTSGGLYNELQNYFKGEVEFVVDSNNICITDNRDRTEYIVTRPVSRLIVSGTGAVTQALDADKFYVFGTPSSLTITLNAVGVEPLVHEYHFRFTSGSTATTLNLPVTVTMPSGFAVEASKTYEISIIDNYGAYIVW